MENSAEKTKRQNTIELRQKRQQEFLLDKFKEIHIPAVACKKANISRATYYRWREDKEFALKADEASREGKESTIDFVESQLIKKTSEGNMHAIKYFLGHNSDTYRLRPDVIANAERTKELEDIKQAWKFILEDTKERSETAETLKKLTKENSRLRKKVKNEAIKATFGS